MRRPLSSQALAVLELLQRDGARSGDSLAVELNTPNASVRRCMSELERNGYRVIRPGSGIAHGEYRVL